MDYCVNQKAVDEPVGIVCFGIGVKAMGEISSSNANSDSLFESDINSFQ